jgi:hypothetical protein
MSMLENRLSDSAIVSAAMAGFLAGMPQAAAAFEMPAFSIGGLSSVNAGWSAQGQHSFMLDAAAFHGFTSPVLLGGEGTASGTASGPQSSSTSNAMETLSNPLDGGGAVDGAAPPEAPVADIAPEPAAISFAGPDMAAAGMMEALLIIGDAVPSRAPDAMNGAAAKQAIADVLAEGAVDALVQQFEDQPSDGHVAAAEIVTDQISEILGLDIGGSAITMVPGINEVSVDDGAELALSHG